MTTQDHTPFQKAIEAVESLPFEDREELLDVLRIRMAEDRREQIAANAKEAIDAVKEKKSFYGTVEDLKKDLLGSDV
jgi:hypothetical protein